MSIEYEARKVIDRLKKSAEETTGESYANLTEAHQALKNGYGQSGSSSEESFVGITDFTDFWSNGKNVAVYDKIDTSEGIIFDRILSPNKTIEKLPKHLKVTNKATSLVAMFQGCYELKELPEIFDTSNCMNFTSAFRDCGITDLSKINTSNGVTFDSAFYRQYGTKKVVLPDIVDMTNATTAIGMCYGANITTFPFINTEKVTSFRNAFYTGGFTEAELDLTSCTDMRATFDSCSKLKTLTLHNAQQMTSRFFEVCFKGCSALTDFSIDVLNIIDNYLDFSPCKNLTVQSLINILNALLDNTGVYDKNGNPYSIKLGSDNITRLKDQGIEDHQDELYYISIATNKNINLV